jgi:uncharacterized membrane protein YkoI
MKTRWRWVVAVVLAMSLLGGGVVVASAQPVQVSNRSSVVSSVRDGATSLARLVGLADDERAVAPGMLDDGKDLLPQAGISLDAAIAAAKTAAPGAIGEVDLEQDDGRLVFNVDVGDQDVKVDAATGEVVGAISDD